VANTAHTEVHRRCITRKQGVSVPGITVDRGTTHARADLRCAHRRPSSGGGASMPALPGGPTTTHSLETCLRSTPGAPPPLVPPVEHCRYRRTPRLRRAPAWLPSTSGRLQAPPRTVTSFLAWVRWRRTRRCAACEPLAVAVGAVDMQGVPVADEAVLQAQRRDHAEEGDHAEEIVDAVARHVGVDRVGWAAAQCASRWCSTTLMCLAA
jgi:hypothetical protein